MVFSCFQSHVCTSKSTPETILAATTDYLEGGREAGRQKLTTLRMHTMHPF